MALNPVTEHTFTAEVLESEQPVLVDFTASWCPPCRVMNPILDDMAADRDDLKIVSVDVDSEQELAVRYGVLGMPTFMLFHHGQVIQSLTGGRRAQQLVQGSSLRGAQRAEDLVLGLGHRCFGGGEPVVSRRRQLAAVAAPVGR